jgi:hypothetical protein
MERLSGLDAFFLYLETPTQPLNVCCVLGLNTKTMPGGYTYGRFRAAFARHVKAVPEFRMKLADNQLNLDHPVWVDDENFQLRRHLQRVVLPGRVDARKSSRATCYSPGWRQRAVARWSPQSTPTADRRVAGHDVSEQVAAAWTRMRSPTNIVAALAKARYFCRGGNRRRQWANTTTKPSAGTAP